MSVLCVCVLGWGGGGVGGGRVGRAGGGGGGVGHNEGFVIHFIHSPPATEPSKGNSDNF